MFICGVAVEAVVKVHISTLSVVAVEVDMLSIALKCLI